MSPSRKQVRPGDNLSASPTEQLSVDVPISINRRLGELRRELRDAGAGKVEKYEIVAAMLHHGLHQERQRGIVELKRQLRAYNEAKARSVMRDPPKSDETPVYYSPLRRGRPSG